MKHKYLNSIGISSNESCIFNTAEKNTDKRQPLFAKQREEYGFDERETWSLDYTLATWLYSHLKMYLETGGNVVDLTYHTFYVPVLEEIPESELEFQRENYLIAKEYHKKDFATLTEKDCIEKMLEYMEYYMTHANSLGEEAKGHEKYTCALEILAVIHGSLWW